MEETDVTFLMEEKGTKNSMEETDATFLMEETDTITSMAETATIRLTAAMATMFSR